MVVERDQNAGDQALAPSAGAAALEDGSGPPLFVLLALALGAVERRHLERMAQLGFDDVRRAHNAVFANLPAEGLRLTELAEAAGITKQAMAELVDDLVAKGYLEKAPDPTDRRAKLIVWAERGLRAHECTIEVVASIDEELAGALGGERLDDLRSDLAAIGVGQGLFPSVSTPG